MISKGRSLTALLPLLFLLPVAGPAAETTNPPRVPDRYLFIVDISAPMRSRAEAVRESITSLLMSGMQGQLHEGDQLGIWTYNNQLHTGEFELVVWKEEARNEIVRSVLQFLENQHFSGTTDFSEVMPEVLDVVAHSGRITILLFSDGDEAVYGTPYDEAIADYFRENADALSKKRTPILTILRGAGGRVVGYTIGYPPWPVEFPNFPPEPEPAPAPVPARTNVAPKQPDLSKTLMTTNKGPIVFAEPLIVSGRHSRTNRTPGPTVVAATTRPAPAAATNAPAAASLAPTQAVENPSDATPARAWSPDQTPTAGREGDSAEQESGGTWSVKLIGLGCVLAILGAGGFLLTRRSRSRQRASLITRSMGRRRR